MKDVRFATGDPRSDIQALTRVLYECLTGQLAADRSGAALKPSEVHFTITVAFDRVIARGMADVPDDPDQTARELAVAAREAFAAVTLATEPGYQEWFRREAYAAGRLTNPHIIATYEAGRDQRALVRDRPGQRADTEAALDGVGGDRVALRGLVRPTSASRHKVARIPCDCAILRLLAGEHNPQRENMTARLTS